jgi:hypothetical protein
MMLVVMVPVRKGMKKPGRSIFAERPGGEGTSCCCYTANASSPGRGGEQAQQHMHIAMGAVRVRPGWERCVIRFLQKQGTRGLEPRASLFSLCLTWRQYAANHHGVELCAQYGTVFRRLSSRYPPHPSSAVGP